MWLATDLASHVCDRDSFYILAWPKYTCCDMLLSNTHIKIGGYRMGWCPFCNRELQAETSDDIVPLWIIETHLDTLMLTGCVALINILMMETCLHCGFEEVVDFQKHFISIIIIWR